MADPRIVPIRRPVEWRAIPGYEGLYSITRDGRVWSHIKKLWRKLHIANSGYITVNLKVKGRQRTLFIHSLVLLTWGPPRPSLEHEVNHCDGDKLNNIVTNLEWMTHPQNISHAFSIGLSKQLGVRHWNARLTEAEVLEIRHRYANGETHQPTLGSEYGIDQRTVSEIVTRRRWQHI